MKKPPYSLSLVLGLLKDRLPLGYSSFFLLAPLSQEAVLWIEKSIVFIPLYQEFSLDKIEECKALLHERSLHSVWLLDDRIFHQKKLSALEKHLRSHTCYFFRNEKDKLEVYDQKESYHKNKRTWLSNPLTVDLCYPYFTNTFFYFKGDLHDRTQKSLLFKKATEFSIKTNLHCKLLNKKTLLNVLSLTYRGFLQKLQR